MENANPPPTNNRPVLPAALRARIDQELHELHMISTFVDSRLEKLWLDDKLNFVEEPVEIMDREVKKLKQSRIPIVKVRWNSKRGPKFTWEREDQICAKYPHLFSSITLASN
ncbi:hypothetical protein Tco_1561061 [Tanacetum coccineum]